MNFLLIICKNDNTFTLKIYDISVLSSIEEVVLNTQVFAYPTNFFSICVHSPDTNENSEKFTLLLGNNEYIYALGYKMKNQKK